MKKTTTNMSVLMPAPKGLFLLIFFMLFTIVASFAQKTSTGSGPWNVAGTWTPAGVPGNGDDVTIAAGHTVTVPANATCRRLYISGTLDMSGATGVTMDITNNSVSSATNGLQLNSGGVLNIGASNILYFSSTQASGIVNNGGSIVSTGVNGANGGTIRTNSCCGGEFRFSGTASTTVYNLDFLQNANFNIASGGLLVNGKLSMDDNNWSSSGSTLSPVYGPGSTLHINWNGQGISSSGTSPLNGNLAKMWNQSTGTIGVTAGYPNNVTILNVGNSNGGINIPPNVNVGWRPGAIAVGLNGTLQIGDATAPGTNNCLASLDQVTGFNCGGVTVDNNSTLIGPPITSNFINRGNFTLQGGTTGLFYNYGATIDFAGTGTIGAPQTISTTGASVGFVSMTVSNGTYVRLDDDVTVSGTLTMTSGYAGTSATNSLTVNNTASTAVTGSAAGYVDGPLTWNLPTNPATGYVFPVGDRSGSGAYLPLTLTGGNTSGGSLVTVEAWNANSNGVPDGVTVNTISPTEYWSLATASPFTGSPTVSVTRPTPVSPYNALGKSTTSGGTYTAIGGTPAGNTVSGGGIGATNPVYLTLVNAFLSVVRVGGNYAGVDGSCNPTTTGSLIIAGIGGTAPYTYSVDGSAFTTTTTYSPLAVGDHTVIVRDAMGIERTRILQVLGAVQINGDNENVIICPPAGTTLTASNMLNTSPTWSWTPGGSTSNPITVNPVVTTTYTVTSPVQILGANTLANGSFESGFSFTAGYTAHAGGYGTTPGTGGYYKVATAGNSLCTFFTTLAAQNGSNYYIADGSTGASDIFSVSLTGMTIGNTYRFSFWYAKGSPTPPNTPIEVRLGAAVQGTVTATNHTGWTQANFNFVATATTGTMTLRNTNATGSTDGNDFYIDNVQFQSVTNCSVSASVDVIVDCTLPVELLGFEAERHGAGALLTWSTSAEVNSSHFIIEKSSDGISFAPVGKVDAAGNSSSLLNYSFTDPAIANGVTYYRLVQYDTDGTAHYSEIRTVRKDGGDVQVIPNPNNGVFTVLITNPGEEATKVSIINALGQTVYAGGDVVGNSTSVDVSSLASGIYYLQVSSGEETIVKKIIIE